MNPSPDDFTLEDLEALERRGIPVEEARRQLGLLRNPPPFRILDRPCTRGHGIRVLDGEEIEDALASHDTARAAGRYGKFVPASGAATRMFQTLQRLRDEEPGVSLDELRRRAPDDADAAHVVTFVEELERFAFCPELSRAVASSGCDLGRLRREGDWLRITGALLLDEGLGYCNLPKALLEFHGDGEKSRTAFEDQLREAAEFVADAANRCRVHFTVSPEHQDRFDATLRRILPVIEKETGARFDVTFSNQKPATDTLALDEDGALFRDEPGGLLFRPGGHGALIENLDELQGDLIYIKNIDNIAAPAHRREEMRWKKILGGLAARLSDRLARRRRGLEESGTGAVAAAARFLEEDLGLPLPEEFASSDEARRRDLLVAELDRPLRVCGMVENLGEPGGGPFWVRDPSGRCRPQIVETAEVDPEAPEQQEMLRRSTHFNPVDLVCSVRDWRGRPFRLGDFVDPEAVFLPEKTRNGRRLRALERPGLWNGAMARWNTVFVEVPQSTFTPVKTILDLLRREHAAG